MRFSEQDQREAVEELWPDIGTYCEASGVTQDQLLTGSKGVPLSGTRIRECRQLAFLTRKGLARAVDLGADVISKYENETRDPSAAALRQLCAAMNCTPADLFREHDPVPA